jgi:SAM-dependent methyltransferase
MEAHEYAKMFNLETHYWWYQGLNELVLHYIKQCRADTPLKILDAGCGTGRMTELLHEYGIIEGIDYSSVAIDFCKKRGLKNTTVMDLNTWEPAADMYDTIVSLDVIYHAGITDDIAILRKFYTALKPQGILILNLPAFDCLQREHDQVVFGKRRYQRYKTVRELNQIGFSCIVSTYRLPALFIFIMLKNLLSRKQPSLESDLKELPTYINKFLFFINHIENKIITSGIRLPFGSSLFIVCKK